MKVKENWVKVTSDTRSTFDLNQLRVLIADKAQEVLTSSAAEKR